MSLFGTLLVGRQSLIAQSRAIQVTSNNIANVNTPGYTRQRPIFEPISPGFRPDGFGAGGGVEVSRVQRIVDSAIEAQLQRERQELSFDSSVESGLARIEGIFEELGGTGISAALSDFFGSLNDLANHPSDPSVRNQVVQTAITLSDSIRDADRRLSQLQTDSNAQVGQIAGEINGIARDIAQLNRQIFQKEVGGIATASALRDRRSQLLEQLADKIDFTSFERSNGQIAVFVAGGFLLVDNEVAGRLDVNTDQSQQPLANPSFVHVLQNIEGQIAGPITSEITGGELGGALALRDSRIPFYRDSLDEFAYNLARTVNDQHRLGFAIDDPASTVDDLARRLFVDPTQPDPLGEGPDFATVAGAAAVIAVNSEIIGNSALLAAGGTALPGVDRGAAPGDNTNARALANLATLSATQYRVGDNVAAPPPASNPQNSLPGFLEALAGTLGAEAQATRRALAQEELIVAQLEERRSSLSGVSIDEEVTNLIRFERAYQAAAKVIDTANKLLEQLLRI